MPCLAKGTAVPSCEGPRTFTADPKGFVFCSVCKQARKAHFAGIDRMNQRNATRVASIERSLRDASLTGVAMQKQVTAASEQAVVDSFSEALTGRAPADFALMACGSMARREMIAYSDIDAVLVLSNADGRARDYFEGVVQTVGARLIFAGGNDTQFRFCVGGLSPVQFCSTVDQLIEQATSAGEGSHERGALFTRRIMGHATLGNAYVKACETALKEGGRGKSAALAKFSEHLARRETDWHGIKPGDLKVDIKSQLYRPIHMLTTELALYYGVPGLETRGQVLGLVEKKKMSLQTANLVMQVLEDYARLGTALQLAAKTEIHWVVLRPPTKADGEDGAYITDKKLPVANAATKRAVEEMARRVGTFWNMSEHWYYEKVRKYALSRKNPFLSKNPLGDYAAH